MKVNTFNSLVWIAALVLLTACGGGSGGDGSDDATRTERAFMSIGTAPPGGAFFPVGGAIAEVLNAHGDGWQVTAEATKGSQENIRRLARGELDLALANAAITYFAVRGESGWDQVYPMRVVMTLAPNVALFISPEGKGVESIADLAGRRVVVGPAGAGFEFFIGPLLEAHGVSYEDFTPLNNTQTGAVDMLGDGSAAAAFLGGAVPTASITQAATSQQIVFVPYDEQTIQQLTETYLFFNPATIPAGTYRDQDEPFNGLDVGSMQLITSADVSDDLIYAVTKSIYENREEVTAKHAAGRAINPKNVVRDTGTEFHPGAIRYYKEIGIWPEP
jgi:TRAP transporter TAXI family solute receptor